MPPRKVGAGSTATTSCPSSFKVSGSPTGSKSPSTLRPRKPKPPPPDPSGHHQNSTIALGRAGQSGGDDGAALLGRVGRRPSGTHILLQPIQSACVEAVQPVAHRVAAQIHPSGDLLRLQTVHGMDDDPGTPDERGSKRVGARHPLHVHPLTIIQLPHSKGHGRAPKPIAMSPQQRFDPAISNDLPDAPVSAGFDFSSRTASA